MIVLKMRLLFIIIYIFDEQIYTISGIQEAIDETDTVWTIGHLSSGGI